MIKKSKRNIVNNMNFDVMEYLIQKLESRQKKAIKFKNIINSINSYEAFYSQQKELYMVFNELEEDLKQAIFSIKALILQNKNLLAVINTKQNEDKILNEKLNNTIKENEVLKIQLFTFKKKSNDFNDENKGEQFIVNDINNEFEEPKIEYFNEKPNNLSNNENIEGLKKKTDEKKYDEYEKYEQLSNVKNILKEINNNRMNLKNVIKQHMKNKNLNFSN